MDRARRKETETQEEVLETAIKTRMADAAVMRGTGWHITWKRSKDSLLTDWESIAKGILTLVPEDQREPLVSIHTTVRPGFRPFRVVKEKE